MDTPDDVLQYIQQCAREDRAQLDELGRSPSAQDTHPEDTPPSPSYDDDSYGPRQIFNISNGLVRGCNVPNCGKTSNLSRCSACKVVRYCSHEHQTANRPAHRAICAKIKHATTHLDKEEKAMIREAGEDIFVDAKGHFWSRLETRAYMRFRFGLVEALLKVNTALAVTAALDHMLDMLQLCHSDNMGLRDVVPALYLRLGRDQECYDFMKWWQTTGCEGGDEFGDQPETYLHLRDEDVFEDVDLFTRDSLALSHTVAVTLLKIRLMVDLQTLQRARREAGPHVPQEVLDEIYSILECDDHMPQIKKLAEQIKELYLAVQKHNPHFWPALLKPGDRLTARRMHYTCFHDDVRHMQVMLQYNYNAWKEMPGAIGVIEALEEA